MKVWQINFHSRRSYEKNKPTCYSTYGCYDEESPYDSYLFSTVPNHPNKLKPKFVTFHKVLKSVSSINSSILTVVFPDYGESIAEDMWFARYSEKTNQAFGAVIIVDWTSAQALTYAKTAGNMNLISMKIAEYLYNLNTSLQSPEATIRFVGLGYGAQLAGLTSEKLIFRNIKVDTILAVNPGRKYFNLPTENNRLSRSDASVVYGIYSTAKPSEVPKNEATYRIFVDQTSFISSICPSINMKYTEIFYCNHMLPLELILSVPKCPLRALECPANGMNSFNNGHCLNCEQNFCPNIDFTESSEIDEIQNVESDDEDKENVYFLILPKTVGDCAYTYRFIIEIDIGLNFLPTSFIVTFHMNNLNQQQTIHIPVFFGRKQIVQLFTSSEKLSFKTITLFPTIPTIFGRIRQITVEDMFQGLSFSYTSCDESFVGPFPIIVSDFLNYATKC